MPHVSERAPTGWKATHSGITGEKIDDIDDVGIDVYKRAWARLLAKVYEIEPFICPKYGGEIDDRHY